MSGPSTNPEPRETENTEWKIGDKPTVVPTKLYCMEGKVVKGFQRGSKQLGWPTANLDPAAFTGVLDGVPRGVYCGFATVEPDKTVHKAVLSLGNNPHFNNKEETVEAYLVHQFPEDFYGATMKLMICGYLRPQVPFSSLESLVDAIKNDVVAGTSALENEFSHLQKDPFFSSSCSQSKY
mmetsp:Transcript_38200/g.75189  ORF Transcript_38200/g.75189 Transcript_38200/m.75189 type:complete len:180 (-) Transcript_38200:495-1034(-)|eukprot:CAMPEP_0175122644 /NCGR_PEP_ID=MMETSP0087-20121206/1825_1 /TAXON_ID=136419 /ORGANISM="Unknown Unknown, Strain D1" /LENGTH=179 /DNA_ID=CAMNT_0016404293 /DNA_START=73 /DNA_END=612 /DNA_ORIENTATION=+